jgi:hypothetical protein
MGPAGPLVAANVPPVTASATSMEALREVSLRRLSQAAA